MKIAILNIYQDKVNRGAETFVRELSKRLSINHTVDVISDIKYFKLLAGQYDLIIPTNGRLQPYIVRLITWITGGKMVISGQSGVGLDDRLNLYSMPDAFVALTSYALQQSKKRNPFVKIVYIPNGVDLNIFKCRTLKGGRTILSNSAFTVDKRNDLTIKAVAKIKDAKLIIVGGGGDKRQEVVDLGLKMLGKERFETASVPYSKIPDFFKKASVFAFSSVPWESFGIVLVEAMASGLPVVATDDPIRREIVGDAGLFVDPTDTEAYANAIEKALNTNWGEKPRKQAEKFDWDIIAKKYEELFKSL